MKPDIEGVAQEFNRLVHTTLEPQTINNINLLNRSVENEGLCASHLYGDTAHLMMIAFWRVNGKQFDVWSKDDFIAINTAWQLAKETEFSVW